MTRDETVKFLSEVKGIYPGFFKDGFSDAVVDAWKGMFGSRRPDAASTALRRYYAEESSRFAPLPAQIRKLFPEDREECAETAAAMAECPYCVDGWITYLEDHFGAEYEYQLACVCTARAKGAAADTLRRLEDRRESIRAAGKLKHGSKRWPPGGADERFDDDVPF
jgi:hypothetical protein